MKTKNTLFISHEDAVHICDKNQYKEATVLELIQLNIRLIHCRLTRSYSRKNNLLSKVIRSPVFTSFSGSEKESMNKEIKKKLDQYSL